MHRPWYRRAWATLTDIAPGCSGCLVVLVVIWALDVAAKVVVAIALQ